jgi:hypothetical protein
MDIQLNPYTVASESSTVYGAVQLAAAQLEVAQDAREQQAAGMVKLVESAAESAPAPEGTKGHNIDVWA